MVLHQGGQLRRRPCRAVHNVHIQQSSQVRGGRKSKRGFINFLFLVMVMVVLLRSMRKAPLCSQAHLGQPVGGHACDRRCAAATLVHQDYTNRSREGCKADVALP